MGLKLSNPTLGRGNFVRDRWSSSTFNFPKNACGQEAFSLLTTEIHVPISHPCDVNLVSVSEGVTDNSLVETTSWGRIKRNASFRVMKTLPQS